MIHSTSEQSGLLRLLREKANLQSVVKAVYEPAAEDCQTCPAMGECCTDAHFVNVRISRLEAVAMREALQESPLLTDEGRRAVYRGAKEAVANYDLDSPDPDFARTYSCPLFQAGAGCLVHGPAKPAPCIHHACYENEADLPPTSLLGRAELKVEQLNQAVYGSAWDWLPTPVWLTLVDPDSNGEELADRIDAWTAQC